MICQNCKWREVAIVGTRDYVQCDNCRSVGVIGAWRVVRALKCALDGCGCPAQSAVPLRCSAHANVPRQEGEK